LCFEILHDLKKFIIDAGPISEFHLDLIKVKKGVFDFEFAPRGVHDDNIAIGILPGRLGRTLLL